MGGQNPPTLKVFSLWVGEVGRDLGLWINATREIADADQRRDKSSQVFDTIEAIVIEAIGHGVVDQLQDQSSHQSDVIPIKID